MSTDNPIRGHIYRMYDPDYGTLHCLVISSEQVHGTEGSSLALRVTVTSQRYNFPYWVRLSSGDPCPGYAIAYDLDRVDHDELKEDLGELSAPTMLLVDQALRRHLSL